MSPVSVDVWIDERGKRCPIPVIALMRASVTSPTGCVIAVLSDDPAAAYDIPAWCRLKGFTFVGAQAPADAGSGNAFIVALRPAD